MDREYRLRDPSPAPNLSTLCHRPRPLDFLVKHPCLMWLHIGANLVSSQKCLYSEAGLVPPTTASSLFPSSSSKAAFLARTPREWVGHTGAKSSHPTPGIQTHTPVTTMIAALLCLSLDSLHAWRVISWPKVRYLEKATGQSSKSLKMTGHILLLSVCTSSQVMSVLNRKESEVRVQPMGPFLDSSLTSQGLRLPCSSAPILGNEVKFSLSTT